MSAINDTTPQPTPAPSGPGTTYYKDPYGSYGTGTGVGSGPSGDPHEMAAQLIRAQFDDWEKTFKPIELGLMNQLSFVNPQILTDDINTANRQATGISGAMSGILERQNESQGVKATGQQAQTTGRILDLNKALNVTGAENTARTNQRTLDEQILMGSAPNPNIINAYNNPVNKSTG